MLYCALAAEKKSSRRFWEADAPVDHSYHQQGGVADDWTGARSPYLPNINTPMNAEQTAEQKLRDSWVTCVACGARIQIGPNYPPGVPVPAATMEIWCSECKTINLRSQTDK